MIDLLAYDDDCGSIHARVALDGDRLVDMLARGGLLATYDVARRDLRTNESDTVGTRSIDPGTLCVVIATQPRGLPGRRVETAHRPVTLTVGRYLVYGLLHGPAHMDPVEQSRARPWLPVTDAVLEHQAGGRIFRERYDAVLVNGSLIRS